MKDKERDAEIARLIDDMDLEVDVERRSVKLARQLDCEWDECPERFHRFMLLNSLDTNEPFAISMCVQEKDEQPVELIFTLGDAFDIAISMMGFLGSLADE
jgi:hypothetical protein